MAIQDGMQRLRVIVDPSFQNGILSEDVYSHFKETVLEYADNRASEFPGPPDCETGYDSHKPELQFWFFGIMICEYVAGLLAEKVKEGHCNKHRKPPALSACLDTRPVHTAMLRAFRNDLAALVREIDDRLVDLSKLPGP